MDTQSQIRHNAEEVSSYLHEMAKWERNINGKILKRKVTSSDARNHSVRVGSGTVKIMDCSSSKNIEAPLCPNDPHMASELTPATLVKGFVLLSTLPAVVPAARGMSSLNDAEASERERGNNEFRIGNFTAAIKSYTKCLGLKVNKITFLSFLWRLCIVAPYQSVFMLERPPIRWMEYLNQSG